MASQAYYYESSSEDEYIDEAGFTASNLEKKEQVVLGKYNPQSKHLVVRDGLNIKGKCSNNHCPAFKKHVWISKGYGNFDFAKTTVKNFCPRCDRPLNPKSFTNIGYKHAKVHITGTRINKNEQLSVDLIDETKEDLLTRYFDNPEDLTEWIFMQIEVEKKK